MSRLPSWWRRRTGKPPGREIISANCWAPCNLWPIKRRYRLTSRQRVQWKTLPSIVRITFRNAAAPDASFGTVAGDIRTPTSPAFLNLSGAVDPPNSITRPYAGIMVAVRHLCLDGRPPLIEGWCDKPNLVPKCVFHRGPSELRIVSVRNSTDWPNRPGHGPGRLGASAESGDTQHNDRDDPNTHEHALITDRQPHTMQENGSRASASRSRPLTAQTFLKPLRQVDAADTPDMFAIQGVPVRVSPAGPATIR